MAHLAQVCNRYPSLELTFTPDKSVYADGDAAELEVVITRADVEDPDDLAIFRQPVFAQYYPGEKDE